MGGQFAEKALQAAQTPAGQRSAEELRNLRFFVLGSAGRGELVHSAPSGRGTLFWNFAEAIQEDACQNLALRYLCPGETIFQEGHKCEDVFIVLTGFVQLQLLRDESDLGLESQRPKVPVNEMVALEGQVFPTRPTNCDFAFDEKTTSVAAVASNQRTTLRLFRGRTTMGLPRINTPDSPVSPRATQNNSIVFKPMKTPRVVSPKRALRRDDRLLRPVADVIQALAAAAAIGDVDELMPNLRPNFQQRWQHFQEQVHGKMDTAASHPRRLSVRLEPLPGRSTGASGSDDVENEEEKDQVEDDNSEPPALPAERRKVVVAEEQVSCGTILGAAACMAGSNHNWRAIAGRNCQVLVMNSKYLGRSINKELIRRRSERQQMLLNALGGPLKTLDEEKLQNLATAARTILYRRGEVLCHEGELRSPQLSQSRLQVLMLGEARCLRTEEKASKRAGFQLGSRWMAAMQSAGTLLPGHAVNGASILADEPEPFTVVINSAEVLVMSLAVSDLARVMSLPLMEQLKATALERLAWRKGRVNGVTPSTSRMPGDAVRSKEVPSKELARLDNVLHDRPDIVCQSPRLPPGMLHEDGKDMMTSSLSIRRPNPQAMECPRVHPSLIPHLKDIRLKPRSQSPAPAFRPEDSTTSCSSTAVVMLSCDDWGLRRVPTKRSLRRARSMRGITNDCTEVENMVAGPEGKLEDSGTMTSFCANEKPEKKKRSGEFGAVAAELERSASLQGKEHKPIARKPPLPKAGNMKGAESNLRVASIEQFLKKSGNSWRGWSKLGTRTLAKLEDEHLNFNHLLPTV